jgi:hypothetical protein
MTGRLEDDFKYYASQGDSFLGIARLEEGAVFDLLQRVLRQRADRKSRA